MYCIFCKSTNVENCTDTPYPYIRKVKGVVIEHIIKYKCHNCPTIFFSEHRHGDDIHILHNMYYYQVYTRGKYKYKNIDTPTQEIEGFPEFTLCGTVTGRLNSSEPNLANTPQRRK